MIIVFYNRYLLGISIFALPLDILFGETDMNTYPSDQQLADQTSEGNREAFKVLYERRFQSLYDFAVRSVSDGGCHSERPQGERNPFDAKEHRNAHPSKAIYQGFTHGIPRSQAALQAALLPRNDIWEFRTPPPERARKCHSDPERNPFNEAAPPKDSSMGFLSR